tara:strand:- start:557 stop:763 length:207 start_codon:yes stop_codon:yes gene_type:complete
MTQYIEIKESKMDNLMTELFILNNNNLVDIEIHKEENLYSLISINVATELYEDTVKIIKKYLYKVSKY